MDIVETLKSAGIIPVIVIEKEEQAVPLAKALVKGGLPVLEVTFRTKAAAGAIAAIKREVPEAIVGAGTILTVEQLRAAKAAGAVFGVAPGFDPVILEAAKKVLKLVVLTTLLLSLQVKRANPIYQVALLRERCVACWNRLLVLLKLEMIPKWSIFLVQLMLRIHSHRRLLFVTQCSLRSPSSF